MTDAVGGEDLAAVAVEVADDGSGVAGIVVELVGPQDLDVVDHPEQGDVADHEADAEATICRFTLRPSPPRVAAPAAAPRPGGGRCRR